MKTQTSGKDMQTCIELPTDESSEEFWSNYK